MAFLQQDQSLLVDVARRDACGLRARIACRHRKQERIVEQTACVSISRLGDRQRQHHDIEVAAREFLEQEFGLGFPQLDP